MTQENKKFILSQKYSNVDQRRKNARIPVEIRGSFVFMDASSKISDLCLVNSLSTGGLAIEASSVLSIGDVITVTFILEDHIISEVCKITRIHGKEVGCRFISPVPQNVQFIGSFIYKKLFST
ncbi:MAG: PilZ domain-containing protein [bacterium]|nr:PilZ domain-containing protein [bacterium]